MAAERLAMDPEGAAGGLQITAQKCPPTKDGSLIGRLALPLEGESASFQASGTDPAAVNRASIDVLAWLASFL